MGESLPADIGELRERFLDRARLDVATLVAACDEVRQQPGRAAQADLSTMSALLHRLAGSAGTFGLERLGLRARRLERLCRMLQQDNDADYPTRLQALCEGLNKLPNDLDEAPDALLRRATPPKSPLLADVADEWSRDAPDVTLVAVLANDDAIREQLRQALEGFGYRVELFDSLDAVESRAARPGLSAIVARVHPDALAGSGLRRLRAGDPDPVPLVVVGPRAEFADAVAAVRGGADGYCAEPLNLPRLESRLHYLIERRSRDGLRVLLVDDDRDLLAACKAILENAQMEVATVDDPTAALAVLADFRPEVVVMDIRMPQCTGPELAQVMRLDDEWLHVPIVYMSSQSDGADQLLATGKAGEAFIAKPIDARELIATVSANGRHARQMVQTASRDTLTGLLKHSFIKEHLAAELERAHRLRAPTCAVMIDLDHFKGVNDRHGHPVGDLVIRTLAALLRQRLRVVDGIGRLGGEEFLGVLSNCPAGRAAGIIDGIRAHFGQVEFAGRDGPFHVSFSAGIAESRGSTHTAAELVSAADKALYHAKHEGRDRVLVARA